MLMGLFLIDILWAGIFVLRPVLGWVLQLKKLILWLERMPSLSRKRLSPEVRSSCFKEKEAKLLYTNMSEFDWKTLFSKYLVKSLFLEVFHPQCYSILTKAPGGKHHCAHFLDEETSSRILCSCYKLVAKCIFEPRPFWLQSSCLIPCFCTWLASHLNWLASVSFSGQIYLTRRSCKPQSLWFCETKSGKLYISLVNSFPCSII